jgi:periplasmic divalent cation tolerance protein
MKNISILYVPCPDEKTVQSLSLMLIDKQLAACIQSFPSDSIYTWNNKKEQAHEIIMLVKTLHKKSSKAMKCILNNHPYKVACIIHSKASVNKKYHSWMKEVLN